MIHLYVHFYIMQLEYYCARHPAHVQAGKVDNLDSCLQPTALHLPSRSNAGILIKHLHDTM